MCLSSAGGRYRAYHILCIPNIPKYDLAIEKPIEPMNFLWLVYLLIFNLTLGLEELMVYRAFKTVEYH